MLSTARPPKRTLHVQPQLPPAVSTFFRTTLQPADVVDPSRYLAVSASTRPSAPIVRGRTVSSRKSDRTMRGSQISMISSSRKSGKAGSLLSQPASEEARSTLEGSRTSVRRFSRSGRFCTCYIFLDHVNASLHYRGLKGLPVSEDNRLLRLLECYDHHLNEA